jgi:hypothetical protein
MKFWSLASWGNRRLGNDQRGTDGHPEAVPLPITEGAISVLLGEACSRVSSVKNSHDADSLTHVATRLTGLPHGGQVPRLLFPYACLVFASGAKQSSGAPAERLDCFACGSQRRSEFDSAPCLPTTLARRCALASSPGKWGAADSSRSTLAHAGIRQTVPVQPEHSEVPPRH